MLTLINRKIDYPLSSLFGFDVQNLIIKNLSSNESSLTLASTLSTLAEPLLVLTKSDRRIKNVNMRELIAHRAAEIEKHQQIQQPDIKINHALVHLMDEKLDKMIEKDYLTKLINKYVFFKSRPSEKRPTDLYEFVFDFQMKKLIPVLVSPEKNLSFTKKTGRLDSLYNRGCIFQIDLLSLTGYHGIQAKRTATYLLKKKYVGFVALEIKELDYLKSNKFLRISTMCADLLDKQKFF